MHLTASNAGRVVMSCGAALMIIGWWLSTPGFALGIFAIMLGATMQMFAVLPGERGLWMLSCLYFLMTLGLLVLFLLGLWSDFQRLRLLSIEGLLTIGCEFAQVFILAKFTWANFRAWPRGRG